jgi:hypothetical protein
MFNHTLVSTSKNCPHSAFEWCSEDEHDPKAIYVNLEKNKESYTAYDGMQIWKAIYQENCMIERLKNLDLKNTCSEESVVYMVQSICMWQRISLIKRQIKHTLIT